MWWIVAAIGIIAFYWIFRSRPARSRAMSRRASPRAAAVVEVTVRRPALPAGQAKAIVAALKRGEEPDEEWMWGDARGDRGTIRMAPFSGRFQSVAGETFDNPDGKSRQSILSRAKPGQEVWLIPEPTNPHDANAVAVYLDFGRGNTGQIGYLPRDHSHGGDLAANKVVAWLAKVGAPRRGAPLGAVLYVVTVNT